MKLEKLVNALLNICFPSTEVGNSFFFHVIFIPKNKNIFLNF